MRQFAKEICADTLHCILSFIHESETTMSINRTKQNLIGVIYICKSGKRQRMKEGTGSWSWRCVDLLQNNIDRTLSLIRFVMYTYNCALPRYLKRTICQAIEIIIDQQNNEIFNRCTEFIRAIRTNNFRPITLRPLLLETNKFLIEKRNELRDDCKLVFRKNRAYLDEEHFTHSISSVS